MLNYIKSECYRACRSKDIYILTGGMCGLILFVNIVNAAAKDLIPNFRYGTMWFSFSLLSGSLGMMFVAGMGVVAVLYSEEHKYGTKKNAVAYGISRRDIFLGKCVVSLVSGLASMTIVLAVYIGSARLMLDGPYVEPVRKLLGGVGAALPSTFGAVILSVVVFEVFEKTIAGVAWWAAIIYFIPSGCFFLGLKFQFFNRIAGWMPANFFKHGVTANTQGIMGLWETPEGLMKCLAAGAISILVFTAAGLFLVNKREIH